MLVKLHCSVTHDSAMGFLRTQKVIAITLVHSVEYSGSFCRWSKYQYDTATRQHDTDGAGFTEDQAVAFSNRRRISVPTARRGSSSRSGRKRPPLQ